jgi:nitrate/nitrite transporter NarK
MAAVVMVVPLIAVLLRTATGHLAARVGEDR